MRFSPPTAGYIANFDVAGVRIWVHWSFPVAGVVIAFMLGDMSAVTLLSAVVAYTLLVLVHEAGHAWFAMRAGCAVHGLVITAGGGFCIADLPRTRRDQLLLFSGGLLAQLLAFVVAIVVLMLWGSPTSRVGGIFAVVFTGVNAILFFGNIVPHANNDGTMIVGVLRSRGRWS